MSTRPLVSVILPTYNRHEGLRESLKSILSQTYDNLEIMVINDGGISVRDVVESFNDRRIVYIELERNLGQAKARNVGLRQARGEFISYLDDDDIYYPEHVETLINALKDSEKQVAYTGAIFAYQEWITDRFVTLRKEEYFHEFDRVKLLVHNYIPFPNIMHRKSLLELTGYLDETLTHSIHEDWDLLIRFSIYTDFIAIKRFTTEIRVGKNYLSTTNRKREFFFDTMLVIHDRYKHLVKDEEILFKQKIVEWDLFNEIYENREIKVNTDLIIDIANFIIKYHINNTNKLSNQIKELNENIKQLNYIIKDKDKHINELISLINQKDLLINNIREDNIILRNKLRDWERQNKQLLKECQIKEKVINDIYNSHAWWLLRKYYRFIDIIMPKDSLQRRLIKYLISNLNYQNLNRTIEYVKKFGIKSFYFKLKSKLLTIYDNKKLEQEEDRILQFDLSDIVDIDNDIKEIDTTISVIIPTKNGGMDLYRLIKSIIIQKGIKRIEIIIVDSGSSDGSLRLLEDFDVKIIEIKPEEFSHSYSRNLGAEYATGEYLFFTVQDALLPDSYFLHTMLSKLLKYNVVATTCHEFMREDVDLYYSFISAHHIDYMGFRDSDKISFLPSSLDNESLRRSANLNNVACLIKKEVFDKYKFNGEYAEDLELGLRLIKDGHRIAFLSEPKIIHSHNREPFYFLKRGYTDIIIISKILPNYRQNSIIKWSILKNDITKAYSFVLNITNQIDKINSEIDINKFNDIINDILYKNNNLMQQNDIINIEIFLNKIYQDKIIEKEDAQNIIIKNIINFILELINFIKRRNSTIDPYLIKQFNLAIYKFFCTNVGNLIAFCHLTDNEISEKSFYEITNDLMKGI